MKRRTADDILDAAIREHLNTGALDTALSRLVDSAVNLLTAKQGAERLGISVLRFRRLGLPIVHFGPKSTRYRVSDVAAEIERRKTAPKQRR